MSTKSLKDLEGKISQNELKSQENNIYYIEIHTIAIYETRNTSV